MAKATIYHWAKEKNRTIDDGRYWSLKRGGRLNKACVQEKVKAKLENCTR